MTVNGSALGMSLTFLDQWEFAKQTISNVDESSNTQTTKGINTFCVPEYDDDNDVIEVVKESVTNKETSTENLDSKDSDQSPDAEHDNPTDSSTPITSPSNEEISVSEPNPKKASNDDNSDPLNGSSHSPIVLDGEEPLVTPRRTPSPANLNASDESTSDVNEPGAVDHDSDRASSISDYPQPDISPLDDVCYNEEGLIDYSDYSDFEQNHGLASESGSSDGSDSSDDDSEGDSGSDGSSSHPDNINEKHQPMIDFGAQTIRESGPTPAAVENNHLGLNNLGSIIEPSNLGQPRLSSLWPIAKPDATPGSSLQSTENQPAPRLPSLQALPSNGWEPKIRQPSPESTGMFSAMRRADPQYPCRPVNRQPRLVDHSLDSHGNANLMPLASNGIYHAGVWPDKEPQQFNTGYLNQSDMSSASVPNNTQAELEPNTRVSIADIVDKLTPDSGAVREASLKRKAVDEKPDAVAASIYTSDASLAPLENDQPEHKVENDTSSQDAQPQFSRAHPDPSTQITGIQSIDEPKSAPEEVRPSKRMKTETQGRGFASHAATAIAGALVGGFGTVALLASLPPDYFA